MPKPEKKKEIEKWLEKLPVTADAPDDKTSVANARLKLNDFIKNLAGKANVDEQKRAQMGVASRMQPGNAPRDVRDWQRSIQYSMNK